MALRFKKGDICISIPPYRPQVFVIIDIDTSRPKNAYTGIDPSKGKRFRLSDDGMKKIGEATADYLGDPGGEEEGISGGEQIAFEQGKHRAENEAQYAGPDQARWKVLAGAQPGDKIKCRIRSKPEEIKFKYVLGRGHKFVWLGENSNGTVYKYPLNCILIDGQTGVNQRHLRNLEEML